MNRDKLKQIIKSCEIEKEYLDRIKKEHGWGKEVKQKRKVYGVYEELLDVCAKWEFKNNEEEKRKAKHLRAIILAIQKEKEP